MPDEPSLKQRLDDLETAVISATMRVQRDVAALQARITELRHQASDAADLKRLDTLEQAVAAIDPQSSVTAPPPA